MVNTASYGIGQTFLPGIPLRAPGNLTDRFTPQQPLAPGQPIGPLAGTVDSVRLSPVARQPLRMSAVGDWVRMFAVKEPSPVRAKASETLHFDGVPATIQWDRRSLPAGPAARIPAGYQQIKGTLPKGLSQAASHILNQGNPIGTYTPFTLNGKSYVALNEYHTHYASRPKDPPGRIYAITVFEKA